MGKDITLEILQEAVEKTERYNIAFYEKEVDCFVYQTSTVCECLTKLREMLEVKCFKPETILIERGHISYQEEKGEGKVHIFYPREMEDDVDFLVKEIYDDYFKSIFASLNEE